MFAGGAVVSLVLAVALASAAFVRNQARDAHDDGTRRLAGFAGQAEAALNRSLVSVDLRLNAAALAALLCGSAAAVENGAPITPFGVMGGAYQPCGHARFVTNLVDYGMDLQEAMDAPRSFSGPEGMEVERGYSDTVRAELAAMGHAVVIPQTPLGGSQAIRIDGDVLVGASDPRKDGCALGY